MTTTTSPASVPVSSEPLRVVRSVLSRVNDWLESRQRAYDDDVALAQLSDRDLHDIGLDRGFVSAVARGRWSWDGPDV